LIYLDSSAVVKLVHEEPESGDLESSLGGDERPLVTSALTGSKVERAGAPGDQPRQRVVGQRQRGWARSSASRSMSNPSCRPAPSTSRS